MLVLWACDSRHIRSLGLRRHLVRPLITRALAADAEERFETRCLSPSHKSRRLLALAAVATMSLGLSACSSSPVRRRTSKGGSGALKDGFGDRAESRNVEFITYYDPSQDAFWNQIKQGAEDAAKLSDFSSRKRRRRVTLAR